MRRGIGNQRVEVRAVRNKQQRYLGLPPYALSETAAVSSEQQKLLVKQFHSRDKVHHKREIQAFSTSLKVHSSLFTSP
jgi:hypothetical protein